MVLNLNNFTRGYKVIVDFAKRNPDLPLGNMVNRASNLGGQIPIVATAHFIGMAIGYTPELDEIIKRNIEWNHYSDVVMLNPIPSSSDTTDS
jgi:hypothetical protein